MHTAALPGKAENQLLCDYHDIFTRVRAHNAVGRAKKRGVISVHTSSDITVMAWCDNGVLIYAMALVLGFIVWVAILA